MKKFLIAALLVLLVVTGCKYVPYEEKGLLSVSVRDRNAISTYGFESADMNTAYYKVTVENTAKNITYETFRVELTGMEKPMEVASGATTVTVDAYNAENDKIGSGSTSGTVEPVVENNFSVLVKEENITSEFVKLVIRTKATSMTDITATLVHYGAGKDYTFPAFQQTVGGFTSEIKDVQNGQYTLYLKEKGASEGKYLLNPTSVRIGAGKSMTITLDVDDNWKMSIEIQNEIAKTPTVVISGGKATYAPSEAYRLTAAIKDISAPKISWWLDGEQLSGMTTTTLAGNLPSDIKPGKHYFTCVAENGTAIWSEAHEFTVSK